MPVLATGVSMLLSSTGCYYGHLAVGQTRLLMGRQGVEAVIRDPDTEESLRSKLELVQQARGFAQELGLEVGGQYTSYVEWPGDRVVTTVVTTLPGTIEPSLFDYPFLGALPYRGYFDRDRAERLAERLRDQDMDVCLIPVRAYSTLGWLDDPLTTPMVATSEERLVETVMHELVHATVFVENQPDFNEGAASFIGQEAGVRFFATHNGADRDASAPRRRVDEDREIARRLMGLRAEVASLYTRDLPADERMRERDALVQRTRGELALLPLETRDAVALSQNARVNDACLALQGTYDADVPRHQRVLDTLDGDLARFIERLRDAAQRPDPRGSFFDL